MAAARRHTWGEGHRAHQRVRRQHVAHATAAGPRTPTYTAAPPPAPTAQGGYAHAILRVRPPIIRRAIRPTAIALPIPSTRPIRSTTRRSRCRTTRPAATAARRPPARSRVSPSARQPRRLTRRPRLRARTRRVLPPAAPARPPRPARPTALALPPGPHGRRTGVGHLRDGCQLCESARGRDDHRQERRDLLSERQHRGSSRRTARTASSTRSCRRPEVRAHSQRRSSCRTLQLDILIRRFARVRCRGHIRRYRGQSERHEQIAHVASDGACRAARPRRLRNGTDQSADHPCGSDCRIPLRDPGAVCARQGGHRRSGVLGRRNARRRVLVRGPRSAAETPR